ncbi:hypothetical protein [Kangiella sp. TOML190]|uniref:hypothetical protein n=1 Tax=Kangiella sp. TOML190 TaxID=2931351 RepID=UPI00203B35B9|nr:hypothetical protein [Kangiella sp. TOML190]
MRYLMGAAFGMVICLLFIGFLTFQDFEQQEPSFSNQQGRPLSTKVLAVDGKPQKLTNQGNSAPAGSNKAHSGKNSNSKQAQHYVYQFKDNQGRLVVSNQKPHNRPYKHKPLDESGYTEINVVRTKQRRKSLSKASRNQQPRYRYHSGTRGAIGKERLVATNNPPVPLASWSC